MDEFPGDESAGQHLWLPPLVATESVNQKLIKGLRHLDPNHNFGSVPPQPVPGERCTRSASGDRSLKSISRYGVRANDRAAEADAEFSSSDAKTNSDNSGSAARLIGMSCGREIAAANKAFESIVAGIDSALAGGQNTTTTVKKDETIQERIELHTTKHYKVPLPSRPTVVSVIVTRTSGAAPALWASTSAERPSSKNYEIKGKAVSAHEERIVYEHAISADEGEDTAGIDRRQAVPRCRELYVTLDAEAGECSYRLHVSWTNIKIVLTRNEISSQVQKMRRGWEARLGELQREQGAREQFEEHVRTLHEMMIDKKKDLYGGKDFTAQNYRSAPVSDPRARVLMLQKQALKRCERQDQARVQRERIEQETDRNNVAWLNKSEMRRQQREQEELERQQEQREKDRQCDWLQRLALIAFIENTKKMSKELMEIQAITRARMRAAGIIHRWVLQRLCYRQRNKMYKNMIRFRMALSAYARHCKPAALCASEPVIRVFLDQYAFHREAPSIQGSFRRFRARVVQIQKWWYQLKMIRAAYISLFLPMWSEIQNRLYKEAAMVQAQKDEELYEEEQRIRKDAVAGRVSQETLDRIQKRKNSAGHLPPTPMATPAGARPTLASLKSMKTRHMHEADMPMTMEERVKLVEAHQEVIPGYIVQVALGDYIRHMQQTHTERLKKWEDEKGQNTFVHDVEIFSGHTDDVNRLARPRVVYVNRKELQKIVKNAIDEWERGGYKHVRHNRLRILSRPFKKWAQLQAILHPHFARPE